MGLLLTVLFAGCSGAGGAPVDDDPSEVSSGSDTSDPGEPTADDASVELDSTPTSEDSSVASPTEHDTSTAPPGPPPTDVAPSDTAEASAPDTSVADTGADTSAPDKPDTYAPDTSKPDTYAPDTSKPDTYAPDTKPIDTYVPDPGVADSTAADTSVSDTGSTGVPSGAIWRKANLTWFTSYPDPGSEECLAYSGCTWAGQFAALDGKQPESWVKANNIAAVHSKDFATYKLKTLRLRQGTKQIDVKVYDMCADSDCSGCCTKNASSTGFLIDVEKYTAERFGTSSGTVEWTCLDC